MNQPNKPNRPHVDFAEVEALRKHAQAQIGHRQPEDDVPQGDAWTPSKSDHAPLRRPRELEVPDFIPLRLDAPKNQQQAQLANIALEDQGRAPMHNTNEDEVAAPDSDFDPEVDEPGESVVPEPPNTRPVFYGRDGKEVDPRTTLHAPISQKRQPQTASHTPQPARSMKPTDHPVLQRLRARFGLVEQTTKSESIGGIKFTFRKYSNQAYTKFITNMVRPQAETEQELLEKIGYAVASISIAAIDDVPVYSVFGVEVDPILDLPLIQNSPLHPPTSIVVASAEKLYPWLLGLAVPELGDTLVSMYAKLFPEQKLLKSDGFWRFSCPKKNCTETMDRKPRHNVDGTVKPYYCSVHGVPMNALGLVEELENIPLA